MEASESNQRVISMGITADLQARHASSSNRKLVSALVEARSTGDRGRYDGSKGRQTLQHCGICLRSHISVFGERHGLLTVLTVQPSCDSSQFNPDEKFDKDGLGVYGEPTGRV